MSSSDPRRYIIHKKSKGPRKRTTYDYLFQVFLQRWLHHERTVPAKTRYKLVESQTKMQPDLYLKTDTASSSDYFIFRAWYGLTKRPFIMSHICSVDRSFEWKNPLPSLYMLQVLLKTQHTLSLLEFGHYANITKLQPLYQPSSLNQTLSL